jgi:hypothetical protein
LDCIEGEAHVGRKFFDSDELMLLLLKVKADFAEELTAVTVALSGNPLDILRVNAQAHNFRSHLFSFICQK